MMKHVLQYKENCVISEISNLANLKKNKRSEINTTNTQNIGKKNKQLQINSSSYIFILFYCLLPFPCLFYLSLSLSPLSFPFSFLFICLHTIKNLDLILSHILISVAFGF